uniref:Uncharacterized protein n=2 Tax=Oryza TaxID=4527 RepID=A0A0D3HBL1_9ORYZ
MWIAVPAEGEEIGSSEGIGGVWRRRRKGTTLRRRERGMRGGIGWRRRSIGGSTIGLRRGEENRGEEERESSMVSASSSREKEEADNPWRMDGHRWRMDGGYGSGQTQMDGKD